MPKTFDTMPPRILVHPADVSAGAYYRTVGPATAMRQTGHAISLASHKYLTDEQLLTINPDIVVFQRQHQPEQLDAMKRYRKALRHATLVYEIDDLLWDIPVENPAASGVPTNIKSIVRDATKLCDVVVTSTEPLAKAMKGVFNAQRIRVMPNYLPRAFIHAAEAGRRSVAGKPHDKPRVGWAGGTSHAGDLALLTEVVRATQREVQWVFVGMLPPGINENEVEYHQAVPLDKYAEALGRLDLDLAVAPLVDNAFNACKSNLRLLEFGACGYPVLASKVYPYVMTPAFHPSDDTLIAWVDAIRNVLSAETRLERNAEAMRSWVKNSYVLEDHLEDCVSAWLPRRDGEVFVPGRILDTPDSRRSPNGFVSDDTIVTVGADVEGLTRADSIAHAWARIPGCSVLYVREGTSVSRGQVDLMDACLDGASVSALSNEGIYPVSGQFISLPQELADKINGSADWLQAAPVPCPYPAGPVILLSGDALSRVGLPDVERFGDIEAALLDWGARALEAGKQHVIATDVYVRATQRVPRDEATMRKLVDHVMGWMPFFGKVASDFAAADPLKDTRASLDLAFNRQNYLGPAQKDEAVQPEPRVLVINGSPEDATACYAQGELAYCAMLNGHMLHLTYPAMANVPAIDMRETTDDLIEAAAKLAIDKIVFLGIGAGTIGAVGYLAAVAERGMPVEYRPGGIMSMYDGADPNGYVDTHGWRATWAKLLGTQKGKQDMTQTTIKDEAFDYDGYQASAD